MTIEIEVDGNAIALVVENNRLTGDEAKNHEARIFRTEDLIWRSNQARWEITFDKNGSPFQGDNSFGPGTDSGSGSGSGTVNPGSSPALLPTLQVEDSTDETGVFFDYTIHVIPNGSNTPLVLDPRVRIFRRGRRPGER